MYEFNIGSFWSTIKHGHNANLFESSLSKNNILLDDYEKTKNIKEINKMKHHMTSIQKIEALLQFVELHKRCPNHKDINIDGWNMYQFWLYVLRDNGHKDLYKSILSTNKIIYTQYEKIQKLKYKRT